MVLDFRKYEKPLIGADLLRNTGDKCPPLYFFSILNFIELEKRFKKLKNRYIFFFENLFSTLERYHPRSVLTSILNSGPEGPELVIQEWLQKPSVASSWG